MKSELERGEVAVFSGHTPGKKPPRTKKLKKYQYKAFLWIAPACILMLIFCYYPPISAMILSFTDEGSLANGFQTRFVGFQHYADIFSDPIFWKGMKNILILLVTNMLKGNIMSILLAELLFNLTYKKLSNALRFLFIIPILVPGVVSMLIWQKIVFSPEPSGLVNSLIIACGGEKLGWYFDDLHSGVPLLAIILTGFPWVGGTNFLIYLAGLQGIDESVIEASKLDGITTMQRVWYIDFPALIGQIKYFVIMGIIGGIQDYGVQLLFTMGGPNYATTVPGYYMYEKAFMYGEYGYASAVGMIIFIITLSLTIVNMKFINKKEEAEQP